MKRHESPESIKSQFVAIRAIRGLCGIGVLRITEKVLRKDIKNQLNATEAQFQVTNLSRNLAQFRPSEIQLSPTV